MQAGGLGAVLDAAGVFFVPVCDDLGFTRSELSLYLTFYFIATVFAMPLVGKWITKYNVNRVLSVSFALVVAAVAAMGFYTQPWQWASCSGWRAASYSWCPLPSSSATGSMPTRDWRWGWPCRSRE